MATIKSYTDISQSKVLAKILPLESADMYWMHENLDTVKQHPTPDIIGNDHDEPLWDDYDIPCWSLASLRRLLPEEVTDDGDVYRNMSFYLKGKYIIQYSRLTTLYPSLLSVKADNAVDACYDMILKLNEQKVL